LWTGRATRDTEIKLVRSGKRVFAVCAAAAVVLAARRGTAQTASGIALERFNPSERGSDWFVLDSLDLRGTVRPAIGVVGDYGYRPLVLYNADGAIQSSIIRDQLIVHVGASLVLVDRIRLAANLPIAAWQDGQGGTLNGVTYASVSSGKIGDTRLGVDVRLAGTYSSPFSLAVGAQVFLPTGDQSSYLSDGSVRVLPRLQVAGDVGPVAYAASAGYMIHAHEDSFAGYPLGGEIVGAASLGVRVASRSVLVGAEATGSTVVTQSDAVGALRQTPIEALLGIHFGIGSDWRAALGAGPGLTRAFGEPEVRAVANIEWAPAIRNPSEVSAAQGETGKAPPDRDKDGVPDADDACPDQPGVKTSDPETNGCPPAPADRDQDGVPDADDACPEVAGVKTDDPKTNGCPADPDRDKDGIPNEDDACPDAAGPASPDPKANGCPRAFVQGAQIKILDQVRFATGSAAIVPGRQSEDVLGAVLTILLGHPEIKVLRVEGHTDNQGSAVVNRTLSEQRAASVVRWLVQHGIDASRLSSQGFGFDRPIDTNDTPEGRKNNRRVEFHIEPL
jgi:outer membrane protein OmpA-like peptidoglycan-associated protein